MLSAAATASSSVSSTVNAVNPFSRGDGRASLRDEIFTTLAGGVYEPRRDPFTGKAIHFNPETLEVKPPFPSRGGPSVALTLRNLQILPKEIAHAPSIGERPDAGLFDVNAGPIIFILWRKTCIPQLNS